MTEKEINEMFQTKSDFTDEIGKIFEKYHIQQIHDMRYENSHGHESVKFYNGDKEHTVDVTGDSELAVLYDIIKMIW